MSSPLPSAELALSRSQSAVVHVKRKNAVTQRVRYLLSCAGALAVTANASQAETYAIDPVHTRVVFAVEHAGFSKAMGAISGSTGTLHFDQGDWPSAQLDVTVPLKQLDMGNPKWNAAVFATNLLGVKRYPEARFVSRAVDLANADQARVCGDLTLHGVTRPLCMDVTFNALKRHPLPPFRRTVGFSATGTLSRRQFGIDAWPAVIGDEVRLIIEAEAVRCHSGTPAAYAADDREPAEPAATNSPH
jgi:polyisoprenoid-binding protein YceI